MNLIKTHPPAVVDRYDLIMSKKRSDLQHSYFKSFSSLTLPRKRAEPARTRNMRQDIVKEMYSLKLKQCETIIKAEKARDDPRYAIVSWLEGELNILFEGPVALCPDLNERQENWAVGLLSHAPEPPEWRFEKMQSVAMRELRTGLKSRS